MTPDSIDPDRVEHDSTAVTDLFHRLNSVIPNDQTIIAIPPETSADVALKLLKEHRFTQLPVKAGNLVLGVFSYRSFASAIVKLSNESNLGSFDFRRVTVDECMEQTPYARVKDELCAWFDSIDEYDAILVGDPDRLQGIVTAMDILRFLYRVASPFVLISEVELALRALIRLSVTPEQLATCAANSITGAGPEPPTQLEQMSFGHYVQIVGHGDNWKLFQPIFGGDRARTRTRLDILRTLRNDIFHFRREITTEDYETLSQLRDWVLTKATATEGRAKKEMT